MSKIAYFDIDDTLFYQTTPLKIRVVDKNTNDVLKLLSTKEFAAYSKGENEKYEFSEFSSTLLFTRSCRPIEYMISLLNYKLDVENFTVELLTARSDVDDPLLFVDYLKKSGIDIDRVHVRRAGNYEGSASEAKKNIVRNAILKNRYEEVEIFDDSEINLKSILSLKKEFDFCSFTGYKVEYDKGRDQVCLTKI